MNHKRSIIAVPTLAVATVVLAGADASAKVPVEDRAPVAVVPHDPGPPNYPKYPAEPAEPADAALASTSVRDDTTAEALQSGASALGGASLALAGVWLYRRRRIHVA